MKSTVLLFNIPDKSLRNSLRNLLVQFKLNVKYIEKIQYNKTLGELAGISPIKNPVTPYTNEELTESMIIFVELNNSVLDQVLSKLHELGTEFPYKACLTNTNSVWTPVACFSEIKKEHEAMHKY